MQSRPENDLLYLLRMLEAMEKIRLFSDPFNDPFHFFEANDGKDADACLMQLAQIGEQSGRISQALQQKHPEVDWKRVKDFRNRIVHDYTGLDRFISFGIIKEHLPVLHHAIVAIIVAGLNAGIFLPEEWQIVQTSPYLKHVPFEKLNKRIN